MQRIHNVGNLVSFKCIANPATSHSPDCGRHGMVIVGSVRDQLASRLVFQVMVVW